MREFFHFFIFFSSEVTFRPAQRIHEDARSSSDAWEGKIQAIYFSLGLSGLFYIQSISLKKFNVLFTK